MDLQNNLAFFINQGPVFWAATAAVGTGGALLVTALFIYLRRFLRNRPLKMPDSSSPVETAQKSQAKPEIRVTDTGYSLAATGGAVVEVPGETAAALQDLLLRLRTAGDRMESALLQQQTEGNGYSSLKTTRSPVEYESRVGIG